MRMLTSRMPCMNIKVSVFNFHVLSVLILSTLLRNYFSERASRLPTDGITYRFVKFFVILTGIVCLVLNDISAYFMMFAVIDGTVPFNVHMAS